MRHDFITNGRTEQVRADWPEGEEDIHPRAVEMAEAMRDIFALGHGVGFRDLLRRGFTSAEIIEHHEAADRYASERSVRQVQPRPDLMPDIVAKARLPYPNDPPLPRGAKATQAILVTWGNYCAARSSLLLDPWTGQRERCLAKLSSYLDLLPIFPRMRDEILQAVSSHLPKVPA